MEHAQCSSLNPQPSTKFMDRTIGSLVVCVAAYAIGSLPFGYLTAKIVGRKDIRQHGSGNIGATNVGRVLGAKWGALVLLLDCLKGLLPVLLLPRLVCTAEGSQCSHLDVACGVATIVGHMFPCWLGLRGGKGVATALGVVAVLAHWEATLAAIAVFAVCFLAFRIVSLSSMLAAVAFAACQMAMMGPHAFSAERWSLTAFSLAIPVLIIFRHRANVSRLLRGEEPRFDRRSRKGGDGESRAGEDQR